MNSQHLVFFCKDKNNVESSKIFTCNSKLYYSDNNSRKFIKKVNELDMIINTCCSFDQITKFLKGKLIYQEKEYEIKDFELYYCIEIDGRIYNKLGVCEVDKELINIINKLL